MTEALKQLIAQEAKEFSYKRSHSIEIWNHRHEGYIAGATSMVEKMEGFADWAYDNYYKDVGEVWVNRYEVDGAYTTSQLLSIYFEQLKKKEV